MERPTALDCLLAARRSEWLGLRTLQRTVALVAAVAEFVHRAQGERGLSSLMLATSDEATWEPLRAQRVRVDEAHAALMRQMQALTLEHAEGGGHGARLLSRLAPSLQALEALPALRDQVRHRRFDVLQSTTAYSRLIAAWLSVVFEVADVAGDAEVSRLLVALFNLTHTKELVGQERARGSALFASGAIDEEARHQVQDLIDSQLRGLSAFRHFANPSAQSQIDDLQRTAESDERARLRRLLLTPTEHGALNAALRGAWFEACTAHMERLKALEATVLADLALLCARKCDALERELDELSALRARQAPISPEQALMSLAVDKADWALDEAWRGRAELSPDGALGPELARHVMDLVQQQARRLEAVTAELDEARASLQERKLLERAKGVLMAQTGMSEEEAYQALRRRAMQQGLRLADLAQGLLRRTN